MALQTPWRFSLSLSELGQAQGVHQVLAQCCETALCVSGPGLRRSQDRRLGLGSQQRLAVSESRVSFAPIDDAALERYVAGGEPFGKAGAYAIQGAASVWVSRIAGSYSGIMGLPLYETAQLLRAFGVRC